jgi:hypothetical protein
MSVSPAPHERNERRAAAATPIANDPELLLQQLAAALAKLDDAERQYARYRWFETRTDAFRCLADLELPADLTHKFREHADVATQRAERFADLHDRLNDRRNDVAILLNAVNSTTIKNVTNEELRDLKRNVRSALAATSGHIRDFDLAETLGRATEDLAGLIETMLAELQHAGILNSADRHTLQSLDIPQRAHATFEISRNMQRGNARSDTTRAFESLLEKYEALWITHESRTGSEMASRVNANLEGIASRILVEQDRTIISTSPRPAPVKPVAEATTERNLGEDLGR